MLCGQRITDETARRLDAPGGPQCLLGSGEFDDPFGESAIGLRGSLIGATPLTAALELARNRLYLSDA